MIGSRFIDLFRLMKTLLPGRVLNLGWVYLLWLLNRIFSQPGSGGKPTFLSVEPTNVCTLQCPECPTGRDLLTRPRGRMSLALFEKIITGVKSAVTYLNLYFQGEPFLHPDIFEMIRIAKKANIYVATSTNAQAMDRELADRIIASGLDRLIISLDGPNEEAYLSYRKGGHWETLLRAVSLLVAAKREHRGGPLIVLQCLWLKKNEGGKREMKALARKLGADKLEFKTIQLLDLSKPSELLPLDEKKRRYRKQGLGYVLKRPGRSVCKRIFTTLVVTWDGKAVACCYDKNADHLFGDLTRENPLEIWHGQHRREFIRRLTRSRHTLAICGQC